MSAIEGSYSIHYAKGPVGWTHPDLPALDLAAAVLNALESYLWRSIRGSGLAYGAHVEVDAESGMTGFSVYRVSQLTAVTTPDDRIIEPERPVGISSRRQAIEEYRRWKCKLLYDHTRSAQLLKSRRLNSTKTSWMEPDPA